jgi:hypothetical protein
MKRATGVDKDSSDQPLRRRFRAMDRALLAVITAERPRLPYLFPGSPKCYPDLTQLGPTRRINLLVVAVNRWRWTSG